MEESLGLLKKSCKAMGTKFFDKKDEDYIWIKAEYHLRAISTLEVRNNIHDALMATLMDMIKAAQKPEIKTVGAGVYADKYQKLYYTVEKKGEEQKFNEQFNKLFGVDEDNAMCFTHEEITEWEKNPISQKILEVTRRKKEVE